MRRLDALATWLSPGADLCQRVEADHVSQLLQKSGVELTLAGHARAAGVRDDDQFTGGVAATHGVRNLVVELLWHSAPDEFHLAGTDPQDEHLIGAQYRYDER